MKFAIVFAAVLALAIAAPLDDSKNAQILRQDFDNIGVDGYSFNFETSDGHKRDEQAHLENVGTDDEGISVRGSVSWIADDGQTITLNYVADKDGYRPEGSHIPHA